MCLLSLSWWLYMGYRAYIMRHLHYVWLWYHIYGEHAWLWLLIKRIYSIRAWAGEAGSSIGISQFLTRILTHNQADMEVVYAWEAFYEYVRPGFQNIGASILLYVCSQEIHPDGGFHCHIAVKFRNIGAYILLYVCNHETHANGGFHYHKTVKLGKIHR